MPALYKIKEFQVYRELIGLNQIRNKELAAKTQERSRSFKLIVTG